MSFSAAIFFGVGSLSGEEEAVLFLLVGKLGDADPIAPALIVLLVAAVLLIDLRRPGRLLTPSADIKREATRSCSYLVITVALTAQQEDQVQVDAHTQQPRFRRFCATLPFVFPLFFRPSTNLRPSAHFCVNSPLLCPSFFRPSAQLWLTVHFRLVRQIIRLSVRPSGFGMLRRPFVFTQPAYHTLFSNVRELIRSFE